MSNHHISVWKKWLEETNLKYLIIIFWHKSNQASNGLWAQIKAFVFQRIDRKCTNLNLFSNYVCFSVIVSIKKTLLSAIYYLYGKLHYAWDINCYIFWNCISAFIGSWENQKKYILFMRESQDRKRNETATQYHIF